MKAFLRVFFIVLGLIFSWQWVVQHWHIPDYLLPGPVQVGKTLWAQRVLIVHHLLPTLLETLLGLGVGVGFGCVAAIVISYFKTLGRWFLPVLIISQAIPTFAIAPILVVWLGFGLASKIAITALMIFFPITSAAYDGLRSTPPHWVDLAITMNGSAWQIFKNVRVPAALPALASGMRIAVVFAPIGAIIGEWVGASQGLGYLMLNANARLQIDMMFAALLVIMMLALILYFTVDYLLDRCITWKME